jgi:glycosyltransferase involved in cell wall biosynthesis
MQPRRICHLTSVHSARDGRIFLKECRALAAAGYDTHLVAPGTSDSLCDGVWIHRVPKARGGRPGRMALTTWRVLRQARRLDADLYHFHDPELIPAGLVLRAVGKHVIYDAHEDLPRDLLFKRYLGKSAPLLSWVLERVEEFAAKRFSGVVAATAAIGTRFSRCNPNTVVVANYPLLGELSASTPIRWRQRPKAAAYVGGISTMRGIKETVEALEQVRLDQRVTLEVAGEFKDPAERGPLMQMPGWEFVREHGFLNRVGVASLLASVRCGLVVWHPVAHQIVAQPIKLYEYMSAGIPVIASNFPLWREIVEGSGCGLVVDPLDSRAIAAALEYLMANDEIAEAMGQRGQYAVRARYNWNSEFEKLTGLYNRLLVHYPSAESDSGVHHES